MPRFLLPKLAVSSLVVFLLCGFPGHQTPADSTPPAIAERPFSVQESLNPFVDLVRAKRENEARLREALKQPVTITFEEIPLKDAVTRLGQKAGVPIWIDQEALREEYFTDKELVSCDAQGISLHKALKQMLIPVGLDYEMENEVIKISTDIMTDERLENRHYEVADLLKWEEEHRYEQRALPNTLISTHRPHDWLQDLIEQETSGPWVELDGTGGTVELHGTVLFIRQREPVLDEIPGILKMLRLFTEGTLGKDRSVALESLWQGNKDLAARRALAKRVRLNIQSTPLKEVANQLTKDLGVPVVLDEAVFSEEGISPILKVSLQVDNITANSAFRLLLDRHGLQVVVYEGKLVITTYVAADELLHTAAYDVRDLIQSGAISKDFFYELLWQETAGPWVDLDYTGGRVEEPLPGLLIIQQTESGQKEMAALFDDMREREKNRKDKGLPPRKVEPPLKAGDIVIEMYALRRVEKPKQVQRAIYDLVEPNSWKPNGGVGTIHIINKMLVVKNTTKVQHKVHGLLLRISTTLERQAWEIIDPVPQLYGPGNGNFNGLEGGGTGFF